MYQNYTESEIEERETELAENTSVDWDLKSLLYNAFHQNTISDRMYVECMNFIQGIGYTEDGRAFQEYEDGSIDWIEVDTNPLSLIETLIEDREIILKDTSQNDFISKLYFLNLQSKIKYKK